MPKKPKLLDTFRYALSDWIAIVSVVVSSFAGINLIVKLFDVGLISILESALYWYREIAHGLIDYVFWFLKYRLPPVIKDFITLWVLIGGLVARTNAFLRAEEIDFQIIDGPHDRAIRRRRRRKIMELPPIVCRSIAIWPYEIFFQIRVPYVYWAHKFGRFFRARSDILSVVGKYDRYRFDLRVLLAVYAGCLVASTLIFFFFNAMLPSVR